MDSRTQQTPAVDAPTFTIVCVTNDRATLERFLLPSLEKQTASYELRLVDNAIERHPSAAAALNAGARGARGKHLAFIHQDVALLSPTALADAAAAMDKLPDVGIAGPIGMAECGPDWKWGVGHGAVLGGDWPGKPVPGFTPVTGPTPVQTLDELLLIIPATVFARCTFDEKACNDWHLYGVDYSLTVRSLGLTAYVLPIPVLHLSLGTIGLVYFKALARVVRKHRSVRRIFTTCAATYAVPRLVAPLWNPFFHFGMVYYRMFRHWIGWKKRPRAAAPGGAAPTPP